MSEVQPESYRTCLRDPIPEIFSAAEKLQAALQAHRSGDRAACHQLIVEADDPIVREWVSPLLGASSRNPFLRAQPRGHDRHLPKTERVPIRMPKKAECTRLRERQGYICAFCRIPLIRVEVRKALAAAYPSAAVWGRTNDVCHAALLAMWLQYDHVLPHSRGGDNSLDNLILTCAGCNYGRMSFTLAEVGIIDPRREPRSSSAWDGLEGFLDLPRSAPFRVN